jgi:CRP/FNR family transcriptional regulator, dissimilatory nitrate respiration regulator
MFRVLIQSSLFKGISDNEIDHIIKSHHHQVINYDAGQMIVQSNEVCDRLLVVLEGNVKAEMIESSGKTLTIEERTSGQPLAPSFLFGKNNRFPVNVIALNKVKMLSVPKTSFIKILQENETILNNFLDVISSRSQFLASKIRFLSFRTIKGKIAHYLINLSKNNMLRVVNFPNSQQEVAELFGVTRPSLSRAIAEMEQEGVIKADRRDVTILDFEKLKKYLE